MTKEQAESLYPLVNNPLWQSFIAYQQAELAKLRESNDWCVGDELLRNQGAIEQIKRNLKLQATVLDSI